MTSSKLRQFLIIGLSTVFVFGSSAPVALAKSDKSSHSGHNAYSKKSNSSKDHKSSSKADSRSQTNTASSKKTYSSQSPKHSYSTSYHKSTHKQKAHTSGDSQVAQASIPKVKKAVKSSPHGNNGTVKIDGQPFDTHPNNESHVSCDFQTDFYNYDEGDLYVNSIFSVHAPTGSGVILTDRVFVGEDPAGGGHDVDAQPQYNLSSRLTSYTPHPKQGYHIKLSAELEGAPGGAKHKVFWVKCPVTQPPTTPPPTGGNGGGSNPPPTGGSGGGDNEVPPSSRPPVVLSSSTTQGVVKSASTSAEISTLPDTGAQDSTSLWAILTILIFASGSLYWREIIVPRLPRL